MCFWENERAGKFVPSAASGFTLVIYMCRKPEPAFTSIVSNLMCCRGAGASTRPGNFLACTLRAAQIRSATGVQMISAYRGLNGLGTDATGRGKANDH